MEEKGRRAGVFVCGCVWQNVRAEYMAGYVDVPGCGSSYQDWFSVGGLVFLSLIYAKIYKFVWINFDYSDKGEGQFKLNFFVVDKIEFLFGTKKIILAYLKLIEKKIFWMEIECYF